jgi:hypothetical protein
MNTPVNVNPSPKARFMAVKRAIESHRQMLETPAFERATDMATMEYERLVAEQVRDGNSAMAAGFKIQGALEFLQILKTLAEAQPMPARRGDPDNLPNLEGLKRQ